MANGSIKAAFERMWQHIVDKFATRKEVEPYLSAMDYTPAVEKDILSERDIDFDTGDTLTFEIEDGTEFAEGKLYVVIYDGLEYRCPVRYAKREFEDTLVAFIGSPNEFILGYGSASQLPDTGEPFCVTIRSDVETGTETQLLIAKNDVGDQHRVRIYEYTEEKYTMDNLELITLDDIRAICILFDPEIHADGTWTFSNDIDDAFIEYIPNQYNDWVYLHFPNGFTSNGEEFSTLSFYIGNDPNLILYDNVEVYDSDGVPMFQTSEYRTIVIPKGTKWEDIVVEGDGENEVDHHEDIVADIKAWFNTNATRV